MNSFNNKNNNNFIIVLGVFIVASAIRIVLNSNLYIVNIIGAVNIIAFWYVWYLILEYAENEFNQRVNDSTYIGDQIKIKKKKYFKNRLKLSKIIVFILGLLYIFLLQILYLMI